MPEKLFIEVMNMSLTASVMILAVMLARVFLRRTPRIFSYILWIAVLFRLLCPISFTANLSLLGILQNKTAESGRMEYIPQDIGYQMEPEINLPVSPVNDAVNSSLPQGNPAGSVNPLQVLLYPGACLWLLGILVIFIYSMVALFRLQKRLRTARCEESAKGQRIYRLPGNGTPFVYGLFRPRIYFPSSLSKEEEGYILLHEQIHIRRGDHIFRLLAYLALCLHWFNPLVWAAFLLSGRDMEMSCDEAVIRRIGNNVKKEYSTSLLALASGNKIVRGIPLTFGEGDTGSRIKNILRYKKPATVLAGAGIIACVILTILLMANPGTNPENAYSSNVFYGIAAFEKTEDGDMSESYPHDATVDKQEMETEEKEGFPYLSLEYFEDGRPQDGSYQLSIRSISRSARGIDLAVMDYGEEEESPFLAFSDTCVFQVNEEMAAIHYREVSFEEFADLVNPDGSRTGPMNPQCIITIQDGLITQISMENSEWYLAGITYKPFVKDTWYEDIRNFSEMEGIDPLETYYTLSGTEQADFGDGNGLETAEIYTGNIGDGDSGIVLFKDAAGNVLYSEGAHSARAGWNNIYLGELDGTAFLMRLHIEDRDDYGEYQYQVFRLGEAGEILQIAGSSFTWDNDLILYDDEAFRQWVDGMSHYLGASRLLLSSQEGEIRTERVSEGDRYNYETLKRGG